MKKLKIITGIAFLTSVASLIYAMWQKKTTDDKVLTAEINTALKFRRVNEQYVFPHPTKETLKTLSGDSCSGIAYQIETNSYSDSDYGNLSRECAVFVLNELAANMKKDESLSEYFSRK
ncbi:MAG: hypothetical protein J1F60_02220 [Oscillospiraceae bacterium]|nr:hypothetical protein [Oscillospiraceae bacterium]